MAEHLADESVDLCVSSIPFGALFMYSGKAEDIGNNADGVDMRANQFGLHMRFFIEQLRRVLKPGRNACIHIQQLLRYVNQHGYMGRRDFRGAVVDLFAAGGLEWVGEVVIPKNPQVIAQRLSLHSLMFVTAKTNATKLAPAVNDYVMIFQKPGDCEPPVRAMRCAEKNPGGWVSSEEWIKWAHGVWDDIQETDVLDGWKSAREKDEEKHVCLASGSLVLTRNGYVPIETVESGDMVLTHMGRWRRVLEKRHMGFKPVVQVEAQGVAELKCTSDHRFWTRNCAGRGGKGRAAGSMNPSGHRRRARSAQPEWMEAHQTLGSYVNLPLPPVEDSPLTADDWWIIGRWLGDGHLDSRERAHISCSHAEAEGLLTRLGKRAGSVAKRETATQIALKDRQGQHSTQFTAMLKRCGRGAAGKRLPVEALSLEPVKAESLLAGYLSADGHYVAKHKRWTASSVSRALLLGMAMVAQRARGVAASVYAGRPAGSTAIQGRTVNTRQDWILGIPPRNVSAMMLNDGAWKKVRKIEATGEAEVWDLQVEGDESFVAEGCVVHNCPLQLEVIRRCVKLYTSPGETVLDPFMGIGSTAYVAIEQGRNAVGFELKESYHALALRNLEKQQREMEDAAVSDLFSLPVLGTLDIDNHRMVEGSLP
ncbi:intein C-terminal splicing region/intein N-terminal splicing region [Prosthecobacter debontii]|uniref:Intein C-terminal splicing region/intein N-terminal splicing region n=1 Tax=Prosthecobacter debontii TaxID=48467 RepID=A0A1T4X5J5_9BACT|nr:DNA methyltransferase [Prosthecobacter debontii]SKA84699.1 intein C-terminal splicing region/intein N-terminal splicing region [Prosthecobacter debontii]